MNPILIIGTGLAGYAVAREFRKLDKTSPLLIVTADDGGSYSKPMLSNAFAQGRQAAQLVTQTAAQMSEQLGASILTGVTVHHLDTAARKAVTSAGVFDYASAVLAVGARPIRLPIEGNAAHEVMSINHMHDYARFRELVARQQAARIVILGAGLIGCEFADDLAGAGHEVTLVDPNPLPLAALASPALAQALRVALGERGVRMQLGTTATRVERSGDALDVVLASSDALRADIVLSAVGLRPDLRLAQAARLATARGILVNAHGETSAAGVYALGDCAEYPTADGPRCLPYVAPLMTAARAIARTLSGQPTPIAFQPAPVIVKTPSLPLALMPPPMHAGNGGRWQDTHAGDRIVSRFYGTDGTLLGFGLAPHEAGLRQALLAELGAAAVA